MSGSINPLLLAALHHFLQPQPSQNMPQFQGGLPMANYLGAGQQPPVMWPVQQAPQMPSAGYLPGQTYLDPSIAPKVPTGAPRPFAPGEYVRNPDGGWSSEISMTVEHPDLNNGQPTVIPSLWLHNGKPYQAANEDEAASFAKQSGLPFPSFGSMDAADQFANNREDAWQKIDGTNPNAARSVPPLWAFPQGKKP